MTKIPLFLFILVLGCQSERNHPVPNVAVSAQINILLPSYSNLSSPGGYAYLDNYGVKGIVIYRRTINEFIAFDRMSTAEGGDVCGPVEVDPNNFLFLNDQCSDAVYSLLDGTVVSGNAQYALRQYQVSYDGFSILTILN